MRIHYPGDFEIDGLRGNQFGRHFVSGDKEHKCKRGDMIARAYLSVEHHVTWLDSASRGVPAHNIQAWECLLICIDTVFSPTSNDSASFLKEPALVR